MAHSETATMSARDVARMRALFDRQDIEDCLARIARGTDRFDRDLFLSGFHDGAMVSVGGTANSPEDTYEGGRAMHADGTFATLHCLSTMSCEIDGDSAHVETYHLYCSRNLDDINWAAAGRYIDQFERRDGIWAITFRHIVVEWTEKMSPHDIGLFEGVAEKRDRLSPARSRDDASYLRPLAP